MTAKKINKKVLKSMVYFFEKYDTLPMEAKKELESASISTALFIHTLKELIVRMDRETARVKKEVAKQTWARL